MHIALRVEINRSGRSPVRINLDLVYVRIRPNLAAPRFLGNVNHRRQRARLRTDFAAKSKTESAIHASAAARARLRQNRHRRWKRIPSRFRPAFSNSTPEPFVGSGGIGNGFDRGGSKGLAPAKPRNSDFPLDLRVIRLQVGVCDRPVRKPCAGNRPDLAAFDEIDLVESPEVRREVNARPAYKSAIRQSCAVPWQDRSPFCETCSAAASDDSSADLRSEL